MNKTLFLLIVAIATILSMVNSQCTSISTSLVFDRDIFIPNPTVDYTLSGELDLDSALASIAEVQVNFSSTFAAGSLGLTVDYQTSASSAAFTYDNTTVRCEATQNSLDCDLGKVGLVENLESSAKRISPAVTLAVLALYTQDAYAFAFAGIVATPLMASAQCTNRLIVTVTLASELESQLTVTPRVLTDSITFDAECSGNLASCFSTILPTAVPSDSPTNAPTVRCTGTRTVSGAAITTDGFLAVTGLLRGFPVFNGLVRGPNGQWEMQHNNGVVFQQGVQSMTLTFTYNQRGVAVIARGCDGVDRTFVYADQVVGLNAFAQTTFTIDRRFNQPLFCSFRFFTIYPFRAAAGRNGLMTVTYTC